MRISLILIILASFAVPVFAADPTPAGVALLVHEPDPAAQLQSAVRFSDPRVRAAAARVTTVRDLPDVLPALRAALAEETDGTAAREELRALVLVGTTTDVDAAIAAAARWPSSMDAAVLGAMARREDALDLYFTKTGGLRQRAPSAFFSIALWRHPERRTVAGSTLIRSHDAAGWSALLGVLREARVAMAPGLLVVSLDDPSEDLRSATVWYLVRGYAPDPSRIGEMVRNALAEPKEIASNREAFARELLRRMLGGEKKDQPRFLEWLHSDEANRTFEHEHMDVYDWFTDAEYETRRNECGNLPHECDLPPKRSSRTNTIPSTPVAPPAFALPGVLPAGLADAIVSATRCRDSWLGVVNATVDPAGRVRQLDLKGATSSSGCARALTTILKLSLATNTSMASPFTAGDVLALHSAGMPMCLDEDPASDDLEPGLQHTGGRIVPPRVIKRVQPVFPASALATMPQHSNVIVIVEAVISRNGCIRSARPLVQAPIPEINGAALLGLSQWRFSPGLLDGKPVDVIFNLTINFKTD